MKQLSLYILILLSFSWGCKDVKPEPEETQTLKLTFHNQFDGQDLDFNSKYTLASAEEVKFSRLAYILSEFYLINENGIKVSLPGQFGLIHHERGLDSVVLVDIPTGHYTTLGLTLGLDSATDHGDPNQYPTEHPLNTFNNSMYWSMSSGYIHAAIEGSETADNEPFIFHIAGSENRTHHVLNIDLNKDHLTAGLDVYFDLNEAFQNPETYSLVLDGMGSHSTDHPVTKKLARNMQDVFSVK